MTRFSGRWARRLRNLVFDLRSGGLLAGNVPNRAEGASDIVNTDITALERIFAGRIRDDDVLVDVGCGKGRVIAWWLRQAPSCRIVGLELDEQVADQTRQRLRGHPNVSIVAGDAVENLPPDGSLLYFYSPFGEPLVRAFSQRIKQLDSEHRSVREILYYNPVHVDVFRDDPAWRVEDVWVDEGGFHDLCVIAPARRS
jgi:SAM-dependent methyltransferase